MKLQENKKKIVFYIDSMELGGAQRVMSNLVNYFSKLEGFKVILLTDIISPNEKEYKINENVIRLQTSWSKSNVLFKNIQRIISIREIIRKEKCDILVSFLGPPNIRACLASIFIKVRLILSVRSDPTKEYGTGIKKLLTKCIFNTADGVVFQTKEAQSYFSEKTKKKSAIILNPVNEKFYNQNWNCIKEDIIFVGSLVPSKNPLLIAKAFNVIKSKHPKLTLSYYGEEELRYSISDFAKKNNISDRVFIYGKKSDIENYISLSRIYVLCSDFEGLPNSLMEAMAVGIPIIASDCPCGGPRSLIKNGENGFLFEPRNLNQLVDCLEKLLGDEDLQKQFSFNEVESALSFKSSVILKQWEKYILDIKMENK